MKKIKLFAFMLVAGITFGTTACDSGNEPLPAPGVDTTPLTFSAAGETKTVAVTSKSAWTVVSSETWLTVTPNAEKTNFTATAKANDGEARTATITVDNGADTPRVIDVSQDKSSAFVIFHTAIGTNFGPHWDKNEVGEFYLEAWSYPVNTSGQPTDEGYKLDGFTVYSLVSENMDAVDFAAGDYAVTQETNTVVSMTIPSAVNMPTMIVYAGPGAATTESLKLIGGTMKVEGTSAAHTITFDFELKDTAGETRQLKGKFTGVIGQKVW